MGKYLVFFVMPAAAVLIVVVYQAMALSGSQSPSEQFSALEREVSPGLPEAGVNDQPEAGATAQREANDDEVRPRSAAAPDPSTTSIATMPEATTVHPSSPVSPPSSDSAETSPPSVASPFREVSYVQSDYGDGRGRVDATYVGKAILSGWVRVETGERNMYLELDSDSRDLLPRVPGIQPITELQIGYRDDLIQATGARVRVEVENIEVHVGPEYAGISTAVIRLVDQ